MIRDTKPYNILIVEDNAGDFAIVQQLLHEEIEAPVITHAINFRQSVELLTDKDLAFDVILLDLSLNDKSGQSLINEMLRIAASVPIIILTGYSDISFSINSISQGIFDYLLKDELDAVALYKSIIYAIERKKTISQLVDSEKRYSDLFHLSPQPMWLFDPETFKFIQVNAAAVDQYGYSEKEFLDMQIWDIRPPEQINKAKEFFELNKNRDGIYKGKFVHIRKDGQLIDADIYSTPILTNGKNYRSVIAIDVTEKNIYEHRITKAIIKTQEDERYEIGCELHDNVCQLLATSQIALDMLKNSLPPEKMRWLNQSKDYIKMSLLEVRNLSHRLAPAFFDDSTLEEAFTRLFNSFNVEEKYLISLQFDDEVKNRNIKKDVQLTLYRILQEQLRNIFKYAKATAIEISLSVINGSLQMKIVDNGIGFTEDESRNGIGFANMKRRTELFYGKFELVSSPGSGCIVSITIPLEEAF